MLFRFLIDGKEYTARMHDIPIVHEIAATCPIDQSWQRSDDHEYYFMFANIFDILPDSRKTQLNVPNIHTCNYPCDHTSSSAISSQVKLFFPLLTGLSASSVSVHTKQ